MYIHCLYTNFPTGRAPSLRPEDEEGREREVRLYLVTTVYKHLLSFSAVRRKMERAVNRANRRAYVLSSNTVYTQLKIFF
jgi:hypothetical protein